MDRDGYEGCVSLTYKKDSFCGSFCGKSDGKSDGWMIIWMDVLCKFEIQEGWMEW